MRRSSDLLDHLVGARQQCGRHNDSHCFRGSQVDHEIELGRLKHWQFCWAFPFENSSGVDANLMVQITKTGSVANYSGLVPGSSVSDLVVDLWTEKCR